MTPQEAIEILEMFLHKQCDLERTKFAYSENTIWIAVNMAKQALEYHIAKTVETIVSNEDVRLGAMTMKAGTKVFKCNNCNSYVSPSHKFCTKCGQALDLSDDK